MHLCQWWLLSDDHHTAVFCTHWFSNSLQGYITHTAYYSNQNQITSAWIVKSQNQSTQMRTQLAHQHVLSQTNFKVQEWSKHIPKRWTCFFKSVPINWVAVLLAKNPFPSTFDVQVLHFLSLLGSHELDKRPLITLYDRSVRIHQSFYSNTQNSNLNIYMQRLTDHPAFITI